MSIKRRLPIGISDFKRLIEEEYAYVDKTLLIQELIELGAFEKIGLEEAVHSALKQIKEKQYDRESQSRGIGKILHIGLAFEGKKVLSRSVWN